MDGFPQALKVWRATRRFSQLDLATEAEISARHLSFLETGRARPSRDMVARLSDALQLPLDARNQLLTHAGFAPHYPGRAWSDAEMEPIRGAVDRMLSRHLPYPGLAVDRMWVVVQANPAARALFGALGVGVGDSLLDLMTSDGLPTLVENWPEVAYHTALRLRLESAALGGVPAFDAAAETLARAGGPQRPASRPVVPVVLRHGELRLSMFATIAQFGTPEDIVLDGLRIELYSPMDSETATAFEAMAASGRA